MAIAFPKLGLASATSASPPELLAIENGPAEIRRELKKHVSIGSSTSDRAVEDPYLVRPHIVDSAASSSAGPKPRLSSRRPPARPQNLSPPSFLDEAVAASKLILAAEKPAQDEASLNASPLPTGSSLAPPAAKKAKTCSMKRPAAAKKPTGSSEGDVQPVAEPSVGSQEAPAVAEPVVGSQEDRAGSDGPPVAEPVVGSQEAPPVDEALVGLDLEPWMLPEGGLRGRTLET